MKTRTPEQVLEYLRNLNEDLPPALRKKVGNILFADDEDLAKIQGIKTPKGFTSAETNTKWEDDLYDKVRGWASQSSTPLAKYFNANIELLKTLATEFPKLLMPPVGEMAYRGTSIKLDSLKKAMLTKKYSVVKIGGREAFYFKNLDYSPSRPVQSWTTNPKIAFSFLGEGSYEDYVQVVYKTKVNKNDFIFNPTLFNAVFFRKEDEVVRVATKGTFEAYVDMSLVINNWKIPYTKYFVHKLKGAQPYFQPLIAKYNKAINKDENYFDNVSTVDQILKAIENYDFPAGMEPTDVIRAYAKASNAYIKTIKKK
jgi:hypothetical protein